jgi:hypothetical protein
MSITKRLASERMVAMNRIFGDLFDFHDEKLDIFELAEEFSFFSEQMDEKEKREVFEAEELAADDFDLDDF